MNPAMPVKKREYDLSMSEYSEAPPEQVLIEGYEVVFDKKVMTTPVEVVALNHPPSTKPEHRS